MGWVTAEALCKFKVGQDVKNINDIIASTSYFEAFSPLKIEKVDREAIYTVVDASGNAARGVEEKSLAPLEGKGSAFKRMRKRDTAILLVSVAIIVIAIAALFFIFAPGLFQTHSATP